MATLIAAGTILVTIFMVGMLYGRIFEVEREAHYESQLEKAHEWVARQQRVDVSSYQQVIPTPVQEPTGIDSKEGKVLVSTTINHKTGEIIEKYKDE